MNYSLRTMPRALRDGNEIYGWLARRSPQGALNSYDALVAAMADLQTDPYRFGFAPEPNLGVEVRQRFFKTPHGKKYRVLFTIWASEIKVLRIRGPGQRPLKRRDLGS